MRACAAQVPFEMRVQSAAEAPQEAGTLEAVKVKILLAGDEQRPNQTIVEVTSENDLFFHYRHTLDEAGFRQVQEQQKLMVDFAEYSRVLIRMLNTCIKEPHSHLAVFVMQRGGRAHLDFIQVARAPSAAHGDAPAPDVCMSRARAEHGVQVRRDAFALVRAVRRGVGAPEHHLSVQRDQVATRARAGTATPLAAAASPSRQFDTRDCRASQARLQDINALVKIKNPSLLLQLQRSAPRFPHSS